VLAILTSSDIESKLEKYPEIHELIRLKAQERLDAQEKLKKGHTTTKVTSGQKDIDNSVNESSNTDNSAIDELVSTDVIKASHFSKAE
jgi:hypothetical protein